MCLVGTSFYVTRAVNFKTAECLQCYLVNDKHEVFVIWCQSGAAAFVHILFSKKVMYTEKVMQYHQNISEHFVNGPIYTVFAK